MVHFVYIPYVCVCFFFLSFFLVYEKKDSKNLVLVRANVSISRPWLSVSQKGTLWKLHTYSKYILYIHSTGINTTSSY